MVTASAWITRGSTGFIAWRGAAVGLLAACLSTCGSEASPNRYRLAHSGDHWTDSGADQVVEDLLPRYEKFFGVLLDPENHNDLDLKQVRDDLERVPTDRRNYDALNALAIGYFELNYRAVAQRGGPGYLADSFRATKILAVPWRAYGLISDATLRDGILDFFDDAASGEKLGTASTAPRLLDVVASLERKEQDAGRRDRIRAIAGRLAEAATARAPEGPAEGGRAEPD
jgi:hypothetical protein